jgi:NDP-sugar pyrophosphorylase family protein
VQKSKRAIVLAGGKGTRLLPYTIVIPKPMLPIREIPIIEIIARQLKFFGFNEVSVSIGYHGDMIKFFLQERMNQVELPNLDFFEENSPLGTAGPVKLISPTEDHFLVINGDILTSIDLKALYEQHLNSDAILTIAVRETQYQLPLGSITLDSENNVIRFNEKPSLSFLDNIGAYVYSRRALDFIEPQERIDVNTLVERLLSQNEKVRAHRFDGPYYWIDIGTHADYEKANKDFGDLVSQLPFVKER